MDFVEKSTFGSGYCIVTALVCPHHPSEPRGRHRVWWHTARIPALERLAEASEFKASLVLYKFRPAQDTQ